MSQAMFAIGLDIYEQGGTIEQCTDDAMRRGFERARTEGRKRTEGHPQLEDTLRAIAERPAMYAKLGLEPPK